ncbi:hypothetical protein RRF57_010130 [Xylaria bambusicola]|uniref:Uncharacterized protein n=1 Tax=Xylaria bambusicola TaxID=326684 RepID=A0AAN7Z9D1_9PEZI
MQRVFLSLSVNGPIGEPDFSYRSAAQELSSLRVVVQCDADSASMMAVVLANDGLATEFP